VLKVRHERSHPLLSGQRPLSRPYLWGGQGRGSRPRGGFTIIEAASGAGPALITGAMASTFLVGYNRHQQGA